MHTSKPVRRYTGIALAAASILLSPFSAVSAGPPEFGMAVPELPVKVLVYLALPDPSIDKDGDGRAAVRFSGGLIETLGLIVRLAGGGKDFQAY